MASPTYKDFDTVCYSKQHNIIQLIKYAVQAGEQLENLQSQIGGTDQIVGDIFDLQKDMMDNMQLLADTLSKLAGLVAIHEERITNIENKLGM